VYDARPVSLVHSRIRLLLLLIIVYIKKYICYLLFDWVMLTSAFVTFVKETKKKLYWKNIFYAFKRSDTQDSN